MEIKRTGLWIGRQVARMCLMVLLVSIMAFGLLAASPIDPLQTNVGQTALGSMSPEQIAKTTVAYLIMPDQSSSLTFSAASKMTLLSSSWRDGSLLWLAETLRYGYLTTATMESI